jgi:predicted alpha/beta hydrolase family esterase
MKQVIIIHGAPYEDKFYSPEVPSPSNCNWIPWLQKQLAIKDVLSQALEMPKPYDPIYEQWVEVFQQMKISSKTTLIGHSCGGGFLLRYLSENKDVYPGKVVLVAPWLDPIHELSTDFFKFDIDNNLSNRTKLHIFVSDDDFEEVQSSLMLIKKEVPNAIYHEFTDKGHFDGDGPEKSILELLEVLI